MLPTKIVLRNVQTRLNYLNICLVTILISGFLFQHTGKRNLTLRNHKDKAREKNPNELNFETCIVTCLGQSNYRVEFNLEGKHEKNPFGVSQTDAFWGNFVTLFKVLQITLCTSI